MMKRSLLSLAVASTLSAGAYAGVNDILITEMVQSDSDVSIGSVEITNFGTTPFTFDEKFEVVQFSSGKYHNKLTKEDTTPLLQGITLEAGKSLVIINSNKEFEDTFREVITQNGADIVVSKGTGNYDNLYLNSDDSIYIEYDGTKLDQVGPSTEYTDWAMDTTVVRRLDADGNVPPQAPEYDENHWNFTEPHSLTDLGAPSLSQYVEPSEPVVIDCTVATSIGAIQGDGKYTDMEDETVSVQGVITAFDYVNKGFYLADSNPDGDDATSDGIFVYDPDRSGKDYVGQEICINATVDEFYSQTQLKNGLFEVVNANPTAVTATEIQVMAGDADFQATLERYEGMLVSLPTDMDAAKEGDQNMRVSKTFGFDYDRFRNNISMAYTRPNMQPNQQNVAGSAEAMAAVAQNNEYRLVLESLDYADNGIIPYFPAFNSSPNTDYIRIDDALVGVEGVLGYSYNNFRLAVTKDITSSANIIPTYERTDSPSIDDTVAQDDFAIRVATQNLFNFFNSPFGGDQNQFGQSRGADTQEEFDRQKAKLVTTIRALDADILGLMEMENNGFGLDSAVAEMVNQVNVLYTEERESDKGDPDSTENRYVFVGFDHNGNQMLDNLDAIGSDAIATGIMYRPSKVSIERTQVLAMPQQKAPTIVNDNNEVIKDGRQEILESGQNYHRDALIVTFIVNQTGKRLTVAVNHFKSKGSTCWEDWQGVEFGTATEWTADAPDLDFQGSCSEFRVNAAVRLGEEMADIDGDKIILGDLNAYAKEDALLVLTENTTNKDLWTARDSFIGSKPQFGSSGDPVYIDRSYGYINVLDEVISAKGETAWSYSYNDEVGSLDHILVSPSLEHRVIDAIDWHINAAESNLYDYNHEYKDDDNGSNDQQINRFYENSVYRSSDHDPALITLSYTPGETDPGKSLRIPVKDKLINVPYQIPAGVEVLEGDIAKIDISQNNDDQLDLSQLVLPNVALPEGETFVDMEVFGVPKSQYTAKMAIYRDGQKVAGSEVSLQIDVRSRDELVAEIVEEESDGSGGSTGIAALISLLGLAGLRRRFGK